MPLKNPLLCTDFTQLPNRPDLVTEASSLGLRAGELPPGVLELGEDRYVYLRSIVAQGELQAWIFRNSQGHFLTLFND